MKTRTKAMGVAAVALTLAGGIYVAKSQEMGPHFGPGMHGTMPGMPGHGPTSGMRMHSDARTMAQLETVHTLLSNHDRIARTVTNLPNGIRTMTESDDPKIAELIKTHVAEMAKRVADGDDPGLPIAKWQSARDLPQQRQAAHYLRSDGKGNGRRTNVG